MFSVLRETNPLHIFRAARIAELLAELEMVEDGTHPKLIEKQRELLSKQEDEQEMIDIMYEVCIRGS